MTSRQGEVLGRSRIVLFTAFIAVHLWLALQGTIQRCTAMNAVKRTMRDRPSTSPCREVIELLHLRDTSGPWSQNLLCVGCQVANLRSGSGHRARTFLDQRR